jgi:hypothetical protein
MAAWVQHTTLLALPAEVQAFLGGCPFVGVTLMPQMVCSVSDIAAALRDLGGAAQRLDMVEWAMRLQWLGVQVLGAGYHLRDFKSPNVLVDGTGAMWVADTG